MTAAQLLRGFEDERLMNITVADAGSCLKKISVEILPDEIEKKYRENLRTLSQQVALPGFRPGKAPVALLEKKYAPWLDETVQRELVEGAMKEAREKHDLDFLTAPEAEELPKIARGVPMSFEVTVEVRPEFDLPEYRGLEVSAVEASVAPSEIDIFIKNVRMSRGNIKALEAGEVSQEGDVLFGDFWLEIDGARVAGRNAGSIEVGSETVLGIPVAEAKQRFTGVSTVDGPVEERFEVTIPQDFPLANHAGKSGTVVVVAKAMARPEMPELTADALTEIGFESMDKLREHAETLLKQEKDRQIQSDLMQRLLDMVVAKVSLDIPKQFAERQLSQVLQREAFQLYQEGAEDGDIEKFVEKRKDELPAHIEARLRTTFVVDAIAKKERVFVTEEDLHREIMNLAQSRGAEPQQVADSLVKNNLIPVLRQEVKVAKVKHELHRRAKITWKKADGSAAAAKSE